MIKYKNSKNLLLMLLMVGNLNLKVVYIFNIDNKL